MAGLVMRLLYKIERFGTGKPGAEYQWVATEFVRERMRSTPWEQHQYVNDLIELEEFARCGVHSAGHARIVDMLRHKYPIENAAIHKEVVEKGLMTRKYVRERAKAAKRHAASQAELAKEREQEAQEAAQDLLKQRDAWLSAGGKP